MKYSLLLLILLISCTQRNREVAIGLEQYKEAMLRSRNVYQRDMNIDSNNEISIKYDVLFYDQLVELNFKVASANSFVQTVINSDRSPAEKSLEVMKAHYEDMMSAKYTFSKYNMKSISDLKVYLDGVDATSCIIAICNVTDCDGNQTAEMAIAKGYNTSRIYLNLNQMSSYAECNGHDLRSVGSHTITFKEVGSTVGRVMSQVIVYNRTFDPKNIKQMYQ